MIGYIYRVEGKAPKEQNRGIGYNTVIFLAVLSWNSKTKMVIGSYCILSVNSNHYAIKAPYR